ncbi:hypothetical protein KORDIASMS9_01486 [Kordia sp. SMS9]|uniref:hypothetical protein n=1 Tax=Kordia sp. SMS9 TaxID=2282170 RepID=UPI000E1034E0|nr:hypothetical protein [Kordia sp. SMS9]AXG69266.1 hypothetical protein KORDIASMS9_01486 [Kordia sp. SMS9]
MNTTYTLLFNVSVSHSYYASNVCECLLYEAAAETQATFQKYGLTIRKTNDGFEVYSTTNQSLETYLNYISQVSGQTAFEFLGRTTDQNFYYFTDIPMNEVGVLTFTSDQTNSDASNNSIMLKETFVQKAATQHALQLTIKFEDLIQAKKTNDPIAYSIQLQARQTQWVYYIINKSNQEYNQLEIQSTDAAIQFTAAAEITLQNGDIALPFSSQIQIPLTNEVTHQFNLINTKKTISGERKEIIFKGLPIPNPQNLQTQDDHTIASLVYLYI